MSSVRQLFFLRILERSALVMLIVAVSGSTWLAAKGQLKFGSYDFYVVGGLILATVLFILLIQRRITSWQTILISQSSYMQHDAFSALVERSPLAVLTTKKNGVVLTANPAAVNLLGGTVGKMEGVDLFDLIQNTEEFDASVLKAKLKAGLTINDIEVPIITFTGKTAWVLFSMYVYQSENQRLVSLVDITEQKHVDTAKSEFVALATHQLRTPISAIRWNVELLERKLKDTETPDQARYLEKINRNVLRMIDLINDFLSVSKLEMGTFATREENIDLSEFFSSIVDEFTEKITEKKIDLVRSEESSQVTIKSDKRLFHIIVSNIVSNAVKYLQPNGRLELSYELKGDQLEMVIADNGIGIPGAEAEKLFTKFFRATNAQTHQTEGTGLGLYAVKQSVDLLEGTIAVESEEDKGARFTVIIPVKVVSKEEIS